MWNVCVLFLVKVSVRFIIILFFFCRVNWLIYNFFQRDGILRLIDDFFKGFFYVIKVIDFIKVEFYKIVADGFNE